MILEQIKNFVATAEKHLANAAAVKADADAAQRCADALIEKLDEGEKALLEAWQKKRAADAAIAAK